jgi:hypothetical protein
LSKTVLLRFSSEDEKKETMEAAAQRRRSLNSYVLMLIHQDKQRLKTTETETSAAPPISSQAQTEAGHRH